MEYRLPLLVAADVRPTGATETRSSNRAFSLFVVREASAPALSAAFYNGL